MPPRIFGLEPPLCPKNIKTQKRGRNKKKTLKTFITTMLGATNVVILLVSEAV